MPANPEFIANLYTYQGSGKLPSSEAAALVEQWYIAVGLVVRGYRHIDGATLMHLKVRIRHFSEGNLQLLLFMCLLPLSFFM